MITLETERAQEIPKKNAAPIPHLSSAPVHPKPAKRFPPKTSAPVEEPAVAPANAPPDNPKRQEEPPPPEPDVSPPPQETALSPKITEEGLIRAIIQRQAQAFHDKDLERYLEDLGSQGPKVRDEIKTFFDQYEAIEVHFAVTEMTVQGEEGDLFLIQTSRLTPKHGKAQESRAKVRWGMVKRDGKWKIGATEVVEKY